jgi:hypothetical protein
MIIPDYLSVFIEHDKFFVGSYFEDCGIENTIMQTTKVIPHADRNWE